MNSFRSSINPAVRLLQNRKIWWVAALMIVLDGCALHAGHQATSLVSASSPVSSYEGRLQDPSQGQGTSLDRSGTRNPLPDRATTQDIWERFIELLKLPHGLVTGDDIDRVFGGHVEYSDKDSKGYMARSENIRNKNYFISLNYSYRAIDKRRLVGPTSVIDIQLPTSDCLNVDQADKDLLRLGMHFLVEQQSLMSPRGRSYLYPDNNGEVTLLYRMVYPQSKSLYARTQSLVDWKNICVSSLILYGYVRVP